MFISLQEISKNISILFFKIMIEVFWTFALVFATCEFGQMVTQSFIEVDYSIVQLNWYLFPQEVQKILPILMASVQKPIQFSVFGSIKSGRETFKNVNYC